MSLMHSIGAFNLSAFVKFLMRHDATLCSFETLKGSSTNHGRALVAAALAEAYKN